MTWWQQLIMQIALSGLQILNARSAELSVNAKTGTGIAIGAAQTKIAQMEFKRKSD